jgi:isopentenyl diphosphate isomerase/L-lactate dehydrogenase-like FMN-dependent dehydrogenase
LRQITQQDPTITKQLEIYVDGGARRGTDVLMALALGAKGVGLGRPFLFAQAAYGEKGVIRAVRSEYSLQRLLCDANENSLGERDSDGHAAHGRD